MRKSTRCLKEMAQRMMLHLQLAFVAKFTVIGCIVVAFRLAGLAAEKWHNYLVAHERTESLGLSSSATTATVLRPLASLLPMLGYVVASHHFFGGARLHTCLSMHTAWSRSWIGISELTLQAHQAQSQDLNNIIVLAFQERKTMSGFVRGTTSMFRHGRTPWCNGSCGSAILCRSTLQARSAR
jgi:hypothetical protein